MRPRTRSACRPARWAIPKSATSTSVRAGLSSRTCPGSTPRSPTARSSIDRPSWRLARGRARPGASCTSSASSGRAASMPTIGTSSPWPSWPVGSVCRRSASTPCSTAATRRRRPALGFVADLERRLADGASVGTDREHRWPVLTRWTATTAGRRVEPGYDAIVHAEATRHAASATAAIEAAYARGETDEFVPPTVIDGVADAFGPGEPIIHANFRADRARELVHALTEGPSFDGFDRTSPAGRPAPTDLLRRDHDRVRGRPAGRGRVPARGGTLAGAGLLGGRLATVPRRGDREVRPRDVLLQRRRRGAVPRARSGSSSRAPRSRPTTCSPR